MNLIWFLACLIYCRLGGNSPQPMSSKVNSTMPNFPDVLMIMIYEHERNF